MKAINTIFLITGLLAASINASESAPDNGSANGLKTGSWTISYYQSPNETIVSSTSTICVNADKTWNTATPVIVGPLPPLLSGGSGGWIKDGNLVTLYGSVADIVQGAAYSAAGHMVGGDMFTGHYVNFDTLQGYPNGVNGEFKATFTGALCH